MMTGSPATRPVAGALVTHAQAGEPARRIWAVRGSCIDKRYTIDYRRSGSLDIRRKDAVMARITEPSSLRDQPINIRASRRQRDLIDQAAESLGKSRSDFMLETACREAERVLLDVVLFHLDDEAFTRFQALLDAPPAPSDALRDLLQHKAPWE